MGIRHQDARRTTNHFVVFIVYSKVPDLPHLPHPLSPFDEVSRPEDQVARDNGEEQFAMAKLTSVDGTTIAYSRSGAGPPLVLVHGTSGSSARWISVLPLLQDQFSVYTVDRRGYGQSGDGDRYALEREFEDIAAIVDSIQEPVNLLGHSYGALCCLGAALLTPNLRRLILYEPLIRLTSASLYSEGVIERLQARLDAGDREGVLTILFRELAEMTREEHEGLRALPNWPARLASAHAVPRETRAEDQYEFRAEAFRNLRVPTLLLLGGDSPKSFKQVTESLAAALPNGRIAILHGQRHLAMNTAPDLFLHGLRTFLMERN
jgi:pimeloyl-ACP methyl ester carboxylesterase